MSNLTPEERDLFTRATTKPGSDLPWFVRAWLWSLMPLATTRGRLTLLAVCAFLFGAGLAVSIVRIADLFLA